MINVQHSIRFITLLAPLSIISVAFAAPTPPPSTVVAYTITGVSQGVNGGQGQCTAVPSSGLGAPQIAFPDDSGTQAMCAAAYSSVQAMIGAVNTLLGLPTDTQPQGTFTFYVTLPDPTQQKNDLTTADCSATPGQTPDGGAPLCSLLTYATDVGTPAYIDKAGVTHPAIAGNTRGFSRYFISLLTHDPLFPNNFTPSGQYDSMVQALGEGTAASTTSGGVTSFYHQVVDQNTRDIPYAPDATGYGISGGGGSGWGAELKVPGVDGTTLVTLLSFGGGGGGGMTQTAIPSPASGNLYAGSGGGGGMQFGNGFIYAGNSQNHLGLGAGVGTSFTATTTGNATVITPNPGLDPLNPALPLPAVQYSYSDAAGCTTQNPTSPNAIDTMNNYSTMLDNLKAYLQEAYDPPNAKIPATPIVLMGGGGMGGGMENLDNNGNEITPHAISTQGGFSFSYTFQKAPTSTLNTLRDINPPAALYGVMGNVYQVVAAGAFKQCGGYDNYLCSCAYNQVNIPAEASAESGIAAADLPSWISNQYCPLLLQDTPEPTNCVNSQGLNMYQQALLHYTPTNTLSGSEVTSNTTTYFKATNALNSNAINIGENNSAH